TETPTNLAEPTKELTEFSIDTGIQEFVIKESEYNAGRAVKDTDKSPLSANPPSDTSKSAATKRRDTCLSNSATSNSTTDNDNQAKEDTLEERPPARFTLYMDTMAAENRGRPVEITSLQPGTTKDKIRGAFTPLGEVEFVEITQKRYGATVQPLSLSFPTDRSRNCRSKLKESCSSGTTRDVSQD
ncbi:hypothetical protein BKA57DRAFT_471101, partial [Linnemannia elongata]